MTHKSPADSAPAMLAFLAGAVTGVAAGLLFAPRGGGETRGQIKDKLQQARMKAMHKMQEQKETVQERTQEVTDAAKQAAKENQQAAQEIQERARRSRSNNASA